jgi:hypothetical protein
MAPIPVRIIGKLNGKDLLLHLGISLLKAGIKYYFRYTPLIKDTFFPPFPPLPGIPFRP